MHSAHLTRAADVDRFAAAFDAAVRELCDPAALTPAVETDGALEPEYATLERGPAPVERTESIIRAAFPNV